MSNLRDPFAPGARPAPAPGPARSRHVAIHIPRWSIRSVAIVVGVGVLGLVMVTAEWWFHETAGGGPIDRHFVAIGRSYRGELAAVYGHAWEDGARNLEAGVAPDAALDGVAKAWDGGRVALFERKLTPELSKIVPEGTAAKDLSDADRARLAAAWRGFARGLENGR